MRRYQEDGGDPGDWGAFRSHAAGGSYQELISRLGELQRGLCAYCEIELTDQDRSIEHGIPRSDPERGRGGTLDPANLLACCRGGERPFRTNGRRYRKPAKRNRSCGAAKGGRFSSHFVDPRCLPATPSVVRVLSDGTIEVVEEACSSAGISSENSWKIWIASWWANSTTPPGWRDSFTPNCFVTMASITTRSSRRAEAISTSAAMAARPKPSWRSNGAGGYECPESEGTPISTEARVSGTARRLSPPAPRTTRSTTSRSTASHSARPPPADYVVMLSKGSAQLRLSLSHLRNALEAGCGDAVTGGIHALEVQELPSDRREFICAG